MVEQKKQSLRPVWKRLEREIELEDSTSVATRVYLGCTQRDAKVNPQAVQSKKELFKRLTTNDAVEGKDLTKGSDSSRTITAWSYDMQGHAEKCVERYCELTRKNVYLPPPPPLPPSPTSCNTVNR